MKPATEGLTAQQVKNLEEFFRAATRAGGPFGKGIQTNRLFDMKKIVAMQKAVGRQPYAGPIADWSDVADGPVKLTEGANATLKNFDIPHYVFGRKEFPRARIDAYELRDVLLSFDVTNNGRVQFYLFTADGALINGLFFGATPFVDEVFETIDTPAILIDDLFPKPNICHFMFDKLPRWMLAEPAFGMRLPLLFHDFGYGKSIFHSLGHNLKCLARGKRSRGTVAVKNLVFVSDSVSNLRHPAGVGGPEHCAAIENIVSELRPTGLSGDRRVMIDRAPDLPRNIVNRDAFEALARSHGFEFQDPAQMSVTDQIALFADTGVMMGVHGAGLSNLAFQPARSRVIELMSPMCGTNAYWIMSQSLGKEYDCVVCEDPEFGRIDQSTIKHDPKNNRRDVVVPLGQVDDLLAQLN